MLLPSLVFGAQIEGARVLEVGGKDNGLVAGFPGQLHAQIPSLKGDENEVEVRAGQVLGSESIEAVDGIPEGTGVTDMFPREGRQARCWARGVSKNCLQLPREVPIGRAGKGKSGVGAGRTAQRSNGGVDGLDEDALSMDLQ